MVTINPPNRKPVQYSEKRTERADKQAEETGVSSGGEKVGAYRDRMRSNLDTVDRRTRDFVLQRPFLSVGLAVAAGYLIGRAISRYS